MKNQNDHKTNLDHTRAIAAECDGVREFSAASFEDKAAAVIKADPC